MVEKIEFLKYIIDIFKCVFEVLDIVFNIEFIWGGIDGL